MRQSHSLAHTGLVLLAILLPQPSQDCRCEPPCVALDLLFLKERSLASFPLWRARTPQHLWVWSCLVNLVFLCVSWFAWTSGPVLGYPTVSYKDTGKPRPRPRASSGSSVGNRSPELLPFLRGYFFMTPRHRNAGSPRPQCGLLHVSAALFIYFFIRKNGIPSFPQWERQFAFHLSNSCQIELT